LSDGSGKAPAPTTERSALSWIIAENGGGEHGADILCGRFLLGVIPDRLLRDHLPDRIIVRPMRDAASASEGTAGTAITTGDATAHDASASRLTGLISIMRGESVDEAPGSVTLVNHLSAALFGFALRFASQGAEAPRGLLALAGRARLQPALSVMFDEPGRPWTLEQFAERCNMSLATFKRQFHDAVGRSATDVLTEVRVTLAGRMLVETGLPVADIAERVGYQSDAAFQRIFKKRIGMTPASYRTSAKTRANPSAAESAESSERAEAHLDASD
jgi:AraC family transcriptional activator of mtrCDE